MLNLGRLVWNAGLRRMGLPPAKAAQPKVEPAPCRDDRVSHGDLVASKHWPHWRFPALGLTVQARTKSEARAQARRTHGPLPPRTECVRVGSERESA